MTWKICVVSEVVYTVLRIIIMLHDKKKSP